MTEIAEREGIQGLVSAYHRQSEALAEAVAAYTQAGESVERLSGFFGTYGQPALDSRWRPSERTVAAAILRAAWNHARIYTRFDNVAPASERRKMDQHLENPPDFTVENIRDLFGDTVMDPRGAALRGLAEQFTRLDAAYKSHTKVRVGREGLPRRVIIPGAVHSYGYGRDRLRDVVRAVDVVRGLPTMKNSEFQDLLSALPQDTPKRHGMTFKGFANGNVHVMFDVVALDAINAGLAEFYGDVLPDAEPDGDVKKAAGTQVSADLAYYPTPPEVCDAILSDIYLREGSRVLEPSCGEGRILDAIRAASARDSITALGVEVHAMRAEIARQKGHSVLLTNFLETEPSGDFDFVFMNPPFAGQHWQKHVAHALKFLRKNGWLRCILPASAQEVALELYGGSWTDLPLRSFAESGTNVCTGILRVRKDD